MTLGRIECRLFAKGEGATEVVKTVVHVIAKIPVANSCEVTQNLVSLAFEHLISTIIYPPEEVMQYFPENKVELIDGRVAVTQYIEMMTPYKWRFERRKSLEESIGDGRLPGHVGRFEFCPNPAIGELN